MFLFSLSRVAVAGIAVLMAQSKTMRQEVEVNQKPFLEMLQHILVEMEVHA